MLLNGFNHVAVLTSDTARLQAFYARSSTPRCSGTVPRPTTSPTSG